MNLRLTVFLGILLLFLSGCISQNGVECDGNCYNGFGTKKWNDGGYIQGTWKDGEIVGHGKEYFGSTSEFAGDSYVGEFGEGGYNGYGTYYSKKKDGNQVGYWKRGKPDGDATLTFNVHSPKPILFYDGNWKDGNYNGFGKLNFTGVRGEESHRYEGGFSDGLFDGMGDYYCSDGTHYHGHFEKGFMDGEGVLYFPNGSKYEGVWIRGQSDGLDSFKKHKKY